MKTNLRGSTKPDYRLLISRREFIKLSMIASGGLGLWLAGCAPAGGNKSEIEERLAVVEEWVEAVNAGDAARFEELHTESVTTYPDFSKISFSGRDQVWKNIGHPISGQLEKISAFGQDQSVCLQVILTQTGLSLGYIFEFAGNLIDKVYEYVGEYVISPQEFGGLPSALAGKDPAAHFDIVEGLIEHINNQDFGNMSEFFPDSAIMYVPDSPNQIHGLEAIVEDIENFYSLYPDAVFNLRQIFGQGNLVCAQLTGENTVRKSFCFVHVVENGKIPETYQYQSRAEL